MSLSILTQTSIVSNNTSKDNRCDLEIDSIENKIPLKMLVVPLISKNIESKTKFLMPLGVICVGDKLNGLDFEQEDIENLKMYGNLACRLMEICGKLEYLGSINEYVKSVDNQTSEIMKNASLSNIQFQCIDSNFETINSMFKKLRK